MASSDSEGLSSSEEERIRGRDPRIYRAKRDNDMLDPQAPGYAKYWKRRREKARMNAVQAAPPKSPPREPIKPPGFQRPLPARPQGMWNSPSRRNEPQNPLRNIQRDIYYGGAFGQIGAGPRRPSGQSTAPNLSRRLGTRGNDQNKQRPNDMLTPRIPGGPPPPNQRNNDYIAARKSLLTPRPVQQQQELKRSSDGEIVRRPPTLYQPSTVAGPGPSSNQMVQRRQARKSSTQDNNPPREISARKGAPIPRIPSPIREANEAARDTSSIIPDQDMSDPPSRPPTPSAEDSNNEDSGTNSDGGSVSSYEPAPGHRDAPILIEDSDSDNEFDSPPMDIIDAIGRLTLDDHKLFERNQAPWLERNLRSGSEAYRKDSSNQGHTGQTLTEAYGLDRALREESNISTSRRERSISVNFQSIHPRRILPFRQFLLGVSLETVSPGTTPESQRLGAYKINDPSGIDLETIDLAPLPIIKSKRLSLGQERRQRPIPPNPPPPGIIVLRGESANLLIILSPLDNIEIPPLEGRVEIIARDGTFAPERSIDLLLYTKATQPEILRRRRRKESDAIASVKLDLAYEFRTSAWVMPFALAAGAPSLASAAWTRRLLNPVSETPTDYRIEYSLETGLSWSVKQKGWHCAMCRAFGKFRDQGSLQFHMDLVHKAEADVQWVGTAETGNLILKIVLRGTAGPSAGEPMQIDNAPAEPVQPAVPPQLDQLRIVSPVPPAPVPQERVAPPIPEKPVPPRIVRPESPDPTGPAMRPPYSHHSTRAIPKAIDHLHLRQLPGEFGGSGWEVISQEETAIDYIDTRNEDINLAVIFKRWRMQPSYIRLISKERYHLIVRAFIDDRWEELHTYAGWAAVRAWLLSMVAQRFITQHDVVPLLKQYNKLTGKS